MEFKNWRKIIPLGQWHVPRQLRSKDSFLLYLCKCILYIYIEFTSWLCIEIKNYFYYVLSISWFHSRHRVLVFSYKFLDIIIITCSNISKKSFMSSAHIIYDMILFFLFKIALPADELLAFLPFNTITYMMVSQEKFSEIWFKKFLIHKIIIHYWF